MRLQRAVLLLACATVSSAIRILSGHALNCPRQDLRCEVSHSNCMDPTWLKMNNYTPSSPEDLQVSVDTALDDGGRLQPVLRASWKMKDDGSIRYLTATELHVLVMSTNANVCVRYSFKEFLPMRSPSGEQWAFSSDLLVLEPGQKYRVSVSNIPKPENNHSHYDISRDVQVSDCKDPLMQTTQFCRDRGSLWQPNISVSLLSPEPALMVRFSPDPQCDQYTVIVKCGQISHHAGVDQNNQMTLNATFSLDKWPRSCCQFDAEIKPWFPQCGNDCPRQRTTKNICPPGPPGPPGPRPGHLYILVAVGTVVMCVVLATLLLCVLCRKRGKPVIPPPPPSRQLLPQQPPKVLVIYSHDHRLYKDVVLKLCAFLQAKCGTKVLVDLLDSTSVGMVGRIRWLEWQRQQLKNPSDKILVLCSRGVQAKWRSMCGEGKVMLREDVLSPTDDILIPFLNLFLPDLHQAGMLGRYMVAYFQDISGEEDVPSVFNVTVKYNLMKNFEELYFRILDIEKYQPGRINQIQGIGGDDYFNCPSGRDLRNAIHTFQDYQLQHPDWFEMECVVSEEEVLTNGVVRPPPVPPVLECFPLIRDGPPVYAHDIHVGDPNNSVHVLTPELNPELHLPSVLTPELNPERHLPSVLTPELNPERHLPSVLTPELNPERHLPSVLTPELNPERHLPSVLTPELNPERHLPSVLTPELNPERHLPSVLTPELNPERHLPSVLTPELNPERHLPSVLTPELNPERHLPSVLTPELNPELHLPSVLTPELNPERHLPSVLTPELNPERHLPSVLTPELNPELHLPSVLTPELNPELHLPSVLTPELNPELHLPSVLTPELNPELHLPSVLTPELNPEWHLPSQSEHLLVLSPESSQVRVVVDPLLHPPSYSSEYAYVATPLLNNQTPLTEEPQVPTEDDEEDSLLPMSQPLAQEVLQTSVDWSLSEPSQPEEMDEGEDLQPAGQAPSSGSDQGYISSISTQLEGPGNEDPMTTLARLQDWLLQRDHTYSSLSLERE